MIAATCQVAEVPLITSLLLLLPRDLSDFAQTLSHRLVCGQLESDLSACADLPGAADEQLMGSNSS